MKNPKQITDKEWLAEYREKLHAKPYSIQRLMAILGKAEAELQRLKEAHLRSHREIEQALGKALHYSLSYPDVSEDDDGSVCVGEHVAESIADEAAEKIGKLEASMVKGKRRRKLESWRPVW